LRKVFGSIGIVLKGSGFYKTDSRAQGSKNGAGGKDGAKTDKAGAESTQSQGSDPTVSSTASAGKDGSKSGGDSSSPSSGKAPASTN